MRSKPISALEYRNQHFHSLNTGSGYASWILEQWMNGALVLMLPADCWGDVPVGCSRLQKPQAHGWRRQ